jgi:uncharacterized protein YwgA
MNEDLIAALAAEMVLRRGHLPGKKSFQKLFYLIEKSGVPTDLDFEMHYYGPYSFALADEMLELERAGVLRIADGSIEPDSATKRTLELFTAETKAYRGQIDKVLNAFADRTGLQLELAATTHLVASWLLKRQGKTSRAQVVDAVRKQKGEKFAAADITRSLEELSQLGLLNGGIQN